MLSDLHGKCLSYLTLEIFACHKSQEYFNVLSSSCSDFQILLLKLKRENIKHSLSNAVKASHQRTHFAFLAKKINSK